MHFSPSAYRSKIYRDFKEIDSCEYRTIIRFFEDNLEDIRNLELEEYFELMVTYLDSLFEIGAYERYLRLANGAIETSIIHNIHFFRGEDVYRKLLFRKAAAHHNLHQNEKAQHVIRELIKMDPYDEESIQFLKKSLWVEKPRFISNSRGWSILLFILAAVVICLELLLVRPFFPEYTAMVEMSRMVLFGLGLVTMFMGDVYHQVSLSLRTKKFVKNMQTRKEQEA